MSLAETVGKELVQTMTPEERAHFADTLLTEFLSAMSREERKDMLYHIMPLIIDQALNGMTLDEKRELMQKVIDLMQVNMKHAKLEKEDK